MERCSTSYGKNLFRIQSMQHSPYFSTVCSSFNSVYYIFFHWKILFVQALIVFFLKLTLSALIKFQCISRVKSEFDMWELFQGWFLLLCKVCSTNLLKVFLRKVFIKPAVRTKSLNLNIGLRLYLLFRKLEHTAFSSIFQKHRLVSFSLGGE